MKNKLLVVVALVLVFSLAICVLVACDDVPPDTTLDQIVSDGASVEGGSFPEGSTLKITPIATTSEQGKNVLEAIKDEQYNVFKPVYILDISVVKDNAKVQPNGKVKVTIPVTAEYASYRTILHIKDDGTIERLSATYANGKITFETDSFSIFVLVEPVVINDHTHTYSDEWSSDKTHHWHAATCGHDDQKSDLGEHTWNDGTEIKPATEKEAGQIKYVCAVCDYEIIETTQTHTHTFSKEWSQSETHHWHAATCVHTDLKDSYGEHRYEENGWEEEKPATETEEGVKVRVCIDCKYEDRQPIPKLEHVHTNSEDWTSDGTYHWHASTCGHENEIKDKAECSGGTATCTQKAVCSVCHKEYGELSDHDFTKKVKTEPYLAEAATCLSHAKYYYSCECGEKGTETFEDTYGRLAICTYNEAEVCTVCETPVTDWLKFEKRSDGESYKVTGTKSPNGRKTECLVVPSTYEGKPVVEIANQAFYYSTLNPKHVVLPDSIQILGKKTFHPSTETITIGKGLKTIDDSSFGTGFGGYENLWQITISEDNPYFKMVDGVMYTKDGKTLIKYPAELEGNKFTIDSNVETIWSYAFEATQNLTEVVIPDNVTTMMHDAFNDSHIQSIDIGLGIKTIPESAFAESHLYNVKLEGNIEKIEQSAFQNCRNLKTLTFGTKVTEIGSNAFNGCRQLKEIEIPDNVKTLGEGAFRGTNGVQSIVIGSGIEEIPISAFENSTINVANPTITIGSNVTTIGDWAFYSAKIRSITIPASVTTIGNNAFFNCQQLTSIVIPNTVKSLDTACFKDCKLLAEVTLSNQLTEIPGDAFRNCVKLTSITIPNSVKTIGDYAFTACTTLETINFGTGLTSIGNNAFENCYALESITIPDGVKELGHNLFKGCSALKTVVLPESVNKISGYTFMDCTALQSVTFKDATDKKLYFEYIDTIYSYTFDSVEKIISMLSNNEIKYNNTYYLYSIAEYNQAYPSSPITEETKIVRWEERETA